MSAPAPDVVVMADTIISANPIDYLIIFLYFAVVLGIGLMARRQVSDSVDFFLSGRSLPAWVTGLAFISANLGAVEIMGMSANGAEIGIPTVHYFWVGAIPAMLFLGVVMMPFYYGSGVRSVPEFMRRRFGTGAHLVNAISFAVAQLLIAGINLYLLGSIIQALLGWALWARADRGRGDRAHLHHPGRAECRHLQRGAPVLRDRRVAAAAHPARPAPGGWLGRAHRRDHLGRGGQPRGSSATDQLNSWPGNALTGFESDLWSVVGIVFGLGFVLSFGYWTTNFVEVQRAMASDSISSARKTPIIGAFPKMFVPFITIIPGMIAAVLVTEIAQTKAGETVPGGASGDVKFNDSLLFLMQMCCPTGCSGVAITGLLAAFMAGMAANISAFNTVLSYDLWQGYVVKERDDDYYLRIGATGHRGCDVHRDLHRGPRLQLLEHHGLPPGPLRVLQRAALRDLHPRHVLETDDRHRRLGWLVAGTLSAVLTAVLCEDTLGGLSQGVIPLSGQGAAFLAASVAFVVDIAVSIVVSLATEPKPVAELKGLVYSETPKEDLVDENEASYPWYRRTIPLAVIALVMVIALNLMF